MSTLKNRLFTLTVYLILSSTAVSPRLNQRALLPADLVQRGGPISCGRHNRVLINYVLSKGDVESLKKRVCEHFRLADVENAKKVLLGLKILEAAGITF